MKKIIIKIKLKNNIFNLFFYKKFINFSLNSNFFSIFDPFKKFFFEGNFF